MSWARSASRSVCASSSVAKNAAIEAEAEAQAACMETRDFKRAYDAFVNKQKPQFEGD